MTNGKVGMKSQTILISILICTTLSAQVLFTEVTAEAGINQEVSGEGATVFDFNNDGLDDIFVPNHNGNNLLYKNLGGMQFVEVGVAAGLADGGRSRLGLAADYDNDGDQDLFVGNFNQDVFSIKTMVTRPLRTSRLRPVSATTTMSGAAPGATLTAMDFWICISPTSAIRISSASTMAMALLAMRPAISMLPVPPDSAW